jgi:Ca2+ transporting ATPase
MATNSLRTDEDLIQKNKRGVYNVEKTDLILIAVIGVRDNPRQEVPEAIKKCHLAGITVRMVTGDNLVTAKAIAKEIGLMKEGSNYIAMEGPDFSKQVGGIVCKNCRTEKCDCPVSREKAEEQKREIRVDTVANAEEFDKLA